MAILNKLLLHKYFSIFVIIFLLLAGNLFYNHYMLHRKMDNTRYVEIMAHQLVLSQMMGDSDISYMESNSIQSNIKQSFNELKSNHNGLLHGDEKLGIHAIVNSEVLNFVEATNPLVLKMDHIINGPSKINSEAYVNFQKALLQYSKEMDASIDKFYMDTKVRDNLNIAGQYIFAFLSLLIIYLSIIFLYLPGEKRLNATNASLIREEIKLRAFINSASESKVFLDKQLKVLYFNSNAAERVKEATNMELKIGDDFRQYIYPGSVELMSNYIFKAINGERIDVELELPGISGMRWYHILLIPVRNDDQKIMGISLIRTDITNRRKAELANLAYIKTLKEIAFTESHLFRAPIANLMGLTDLLKDHTTESGNMEMDHLISLIKIEVGRIDEVIHAVVKNANAVPAS